MLRRHHYKIKVLNTINFKKSMHYNPFVYIRSEKDILKLVNTIIANTKGEGDKSGEDFWVKAEKLYYQALIGYIWYEANDEEKNFATLLEMINASEAREDDESFKNAVDLMFDALETRQIIPKSTPAITQENHWMRSMKDSICIIPQISAVTLFQSVM